MFAPAPFARADLAADLARIALEAAGGEAAHEKLRSLRATGVTRVGGAEVPFILHTARPRSVRIETVGETGSLVRAYDGEHAPWRKDDPLQPPRRLGREEERAFIREADFDLPFFQYRRRGISLDYAGEVEVDGVVYQRLLATLPRLELAVLWLHPETNLLVRRQIAQRAGSREVMIDTHYSDFIEVEGVRLPTRIRTEAQGRVLHEIVISGYDANPELPEDFFKPPAPDWPMP